MLREHAQIWHTLDALERAEDSGAETDALTKQLALQLLHHNLKEEKVLYPRADALAPPAVSRLSAFLDTETLPEGWVCIKARPASGPVSEAVG